MSDDGHEEEEADRVEATKKQRPPNTPETEFALITPEALLDLQADLLCDPCGIPLVDTGKRPPNEDGATHDEMVVYAATRARRLLAVCRDEKWRRLKTSLCYEAIQKTPLPQIAKLALDLIRGRGMSLSEAVAVAVTHIECDDYVRVEMALAGSYMDGVEKFRCAKQARKDHLEQFAKIPEVKLFRDECGNAIPKAFEAGLKELFPLPPSYKGKKAQAARMKRFSTFIMRVVRDEYYPRVVAAEEERKRLIEDEKRRGVPKGKRSKPLSEREKWGLVPEEEREQIEVEAERRLGEMKRDGIPYVFSRQAALWVSEWFKQGVSKNCSQANEAMRKATAAKIIR